MIAGLRNFDDHVEGTRRHCISTEQLDHISYEDWKPVISFD